MQYLSIDIAHNCAIRALNTSSPETRKRSTIPNKSDCSLKSLSNRLHLLRRYKGKHTEIICAEVDLYLHYQYKKNINKQNTLNWEKGQSEMFKILSETSLFIGDDILEFFIKNKSFLTIKTLFSVSKIFFDCQLSSLQNPGYYIVRSKMEGSSS